MRSGSIPAQRQRIPRHIHYSAAQPVSTLTNHYEHMEQTELHDWPDAHKDYWLKLAATAVRHSNRRALGTRWQRE